MTSEISKLSTSEGVFFFGDITPLEVMSLSYHRHYIPTQIEFVLNDSWRVKCYSRVRVSLCFTGDSRCLSACYKSNAYSTRTSEILTLFLHAHTHTHTHTIQLQNLAFVMLNTYN
jgi:hypothetical protein